MDYVLNLNMPKINLSKLILFLFFTTTNLMMAQSQEKERVLVVVEKVRGSVGFYDDYGNLIKRLKIGELPHEMVFTPDRKTAFITNNGSFRYVDEVEGGSTVSMVNLVDMTLMEDIRLGDYRRPHGISYDADSRLLAVGVENPDKVLIINPWRNEIVSEYDNHGKTPHMITLSRGAKFAFVSNVQSSNLAIIDLKKNTTDVVNVGYKPQQSVYSEKSKRLYVGCDDYIAVVDTEAKVMIGKIGRGANRMELIHNDSLLVYSSTQRGFGFASTTTWEEICHLDIPYKPYSLHVSSDKNYAYLSAEEQNLIYIASVNKMKIIRKIKVEEGTNPDPVMDIFVNTRKIQKPSEIKRKLPGFNRIVADTGFRKGYQVKTADINGDLKPDIIAVSDRLPEVYWYENPGWEKHLITNKSYRNIDIAPKDIDGDGDVDLAFATRFDLKKPEEGGYIYWLENPENNVDPWETYFIDSIPTSHRIRWADLDGEGREELLNVPLIGFGAREPDYDKPALIRGYQIPDGPKWQAWPQIHLSDHLHMIHGVTVLRWDPDLQDDFLTASFEGITLFRSEAGQHPYIRKGINLTTGKQGSRPGTGSSEIVRGKLQYSKPFLATIEAWHGNEVVVYFPESKANGSWKRQVIDNSFVDGHAIVCADLNFDGNDEIIAGFRGEPFHLYIYSYHPENHSWQRQLLDNGGMSAAGLAIFDFNADGFPDIVSIGSATGNVVIYENLGYQTHN